MTTTSTYALGSPGWIGALHGYLLGTADDFIASLDGADFVVCEVYTDVPGWVNPSSRVPTTWGVRAGAFQFSLTEADKADVDMKIVAHWDVIAPMGEAQSADMGPLQATLPQEMAAGRFVAEVTAAPPAFLSVVHDAIAAITDNSPPA